MRGQGQIGPRGHGKRLAAAARAIVQHPHPVVQRQRLHRPLGGEVLKLHQAPGIGFCCFDFLFFISHFQREVRIVCECRFHPLGRQRPCRRLASVPGIGAQVDRRALAHPGQDLIGVIAQSRVEVGHQPVGAVKAHPARQRGQIRGRRPLLRRQRLRAVAHAGEQAFRRHAACAQQADHQAPARLRPAKGREGPAAAQRVIDMVAHRRPVARSGKAAAARPAGQRLFRRLPVQHRVKDRDRRRDARFGGHSDGPRISRSGSSGFPA